MRFYVVPKIGDGVTPVTAFRPQYISDLSVPWYAMDYGKEGMFLVGADVTAAQHTTLIGNPDVTAIPQDLDSLVSAAALTIIQDRLEGWKIPGNWVTTNHTYREVVATVGKMCLLLQRFDGLHAMTLFQSGITLDTRVNQLTAGQRDQLSAAAVSLGLDISFITGSMVIRDVLRTWIGQLPAVSLAGEVF